MFLDHAKAEKECEDEAVDTVIPLEPFDMALVEMPEYSRMLHTVSAKFF